MNKNIGKTFYSDYFNGDIIVVDYKDDDNWWFVVVGQREVLKAQTPLSYFEKGTK